MNTYIVLFEYEVCGQMTLPVSIYVKNNEIKTGIHEHLSGMMLPRVSWKEVSVKRQKGNVKNIFD